jgi:2-polyprenyl-6-methoxyphenol hydroxylase-like FAD-dependent oxidoreductase
VAIIGTGLSGLATALQLLVHQRQQGEPRLCMSIELYERDQGESLLQEDGEKTVDTNEKKKNATKDGYGLTISYQPDGILEKMNVLTEMMQFDCPSRSHYILDHKGAILGYFGNNFRPENNGPNQRCTQNVVGWGQRGNIRLPRHRVRQILYREILSYNRQCHTCKQENTTITLYPIVYFNWNHKLVYLREVQCDSEDDKKIQLVFENGRTKIVDVVIAADGIRSTVVQQWLPKLSLPLSLQVRLILGITDANASLFNPSEQGRSDSKYPPYHELLQERGFYTLSNGHRLFVMPYSGSALHRSLDPNEPVRFMWQLSFASNLNDDTVRRYTPQLLKEEALLRTKGWHAPVSLLISSTSIENIWGTMLRDRNPEEVMTQMQQKTSNPRVLVIGDALHAMSPFKGQGANQCFRDAVTVSKWFYKAAHKDLGTVVKCATREMVQRTAPIVAASRVAAQYWHSHSVDLLEKGDHPFTGLDDDLKHRVLVELHNRQINAGTTTNLDDAVWDVIRYCNFKLSNGSVNGDIVGKFDTLSEDHTFLVVDGSSSDASMSLESSKINSRRLPSETFGVDIRDISVQDIFVFLHSFKGETDLLRHYSLRQPNLIRRLRLGPDFIHESWWRGFMAGAFSLLFKDNASTGEWTTPLHVGVAGGHIRTVHWLVTEAGCRVQEVDSYGRTALDTAVQFGQAEIADLLERLHEGSTFA